MRASLLLQNGSLYQKNPCLAQPQLFILTIKKCENSAQLNYSTLIFFESCNFESFEKRPAVT